ncbi:protein Z, vitamin K-dependent plasma glycoprotein b [Betta splendens]|uniref:Protein Z, vitamin K-dependent plasma glycoprotein b n=1 Tax=Betta splendens TaxID=158456 RepID=A0A6P7LYI4_BETSP|nr:protein Z, vitamin K-dependent plasma glycoprotein b [Betta splendens]
MAPGIMSACCRALLLCLYLLACFLQVHSQTQVFRQSSQAHSVLLRSRRANSFLLEELLQGNLERECYEERCNFEEAREYFEDTGKTIIFWTTYMDEDQCEPNPCLHGGNCTDLLRGFHCSCVAPYRGSRCEQGRLKEEKPSSATQVIIPEMKKCPTEGPKACQQLCTASYHSFTCSCMPGFRLHSDKRTCLPEVKFPCGRLPDTSNSSESMCRQGNCPWQVSLLNQSGMELCSGVVLGRRSVLTTAHCLVLDSGSDPQPSNFQVTARNNLLVPVQALYIHNRFRTDHLDNDLALLELAAPLPFGPDLIQLCLPTKDFSENVLMHSRRMGVIEEKEGGQNQDLVYMTLDECHSQLNVSYPLTNKMFCMTRQKRMQGTGLKGNQNSDVRNRNGLHGTGPNKAQRPHGHSGSPRGHKRMMDEHPENRGHNHTGHTGGQDVSHGSEAHNSSIHKASEDGDLLPGTPVATVEHGTAYLTGLMISPPADSGGLVFTKLSRYLSWIRPSLEAAENNMTPQVSEYPEIH